MCLVFVGVENWILDVCFFQSENGDLDAPKSLPPGNGPNINIVRKKIHFVKRFANKIDQIHATA